ncbi:MAG: tRNA (N6-isopentenyl adenosine(37)-C2)-methylthiotransferase MiaB [Oscillospiraceae bacterium]|nr:tRNA (N6-isopentenyl adenosine(37)-C2)-methylthiotransferase MiaB [Oscillospiraceae bacterium]
MERAEVNITPKQVQQQQEFASLLAALLVAKYNEPPRAHIRTFGCQANEADSQRMAGQLLQCGFVLCDNPDDAQLILFNTCAVREHAEDRVFGNVGRLKQRRQTDKHLRVGLCGCMPQQEHVAKQLKQSFPFVDLVFGTHASPRLPELLYKLYSTGRRVYDISAEQNEIVEGLPIERGSGFSAFVPIMFGCDNFCSFCVVPLVRGRERSRKPEAILAEVRGLVQQGYKEITLLGQNVNSYNQDGYDFTRLLRELDAIPGDFWLRFTTSHPKDCTRELLDVMAAGQHICRHLHLPVQCGNDAILHAMNRRYTAQRYLDLARYAQQVMPDISITSDIIVGFPGESYEQFCDTLEMLRQVKFASLFTFIFSPRKGTKAADLPDEVPRSEKVKWFEQLTALQGELGAQLCQSLVGCTLRVLVEGQGKRLALAGRTAGNQIIEFNGPEDLIGTFVDVEITQANGWKCEGEIT